ncbi:MAG TPA: hypothetical protein VMV94_06090 [Phycisphaerae bacterium]|nr:hypothetical protein [Phycisphaerae bacterium]
MAFLKAQWQFIVMGIVALASIGGGTLAIMASSGVEDKMKEIDGLVQKVSGYQRGGANLAMIEAKKREIEQKKTDFESSSSAALALQKNNAFYEEVENGTVIPKAREPLMADVLPEPKSSGVALSFRPKYIDEFKTLITKLRARGGPTAAEREREANLLVSMAADEQSGEEGGGTAGRSPATRQPPVEDLTKSKKDINLREYLRKNAPARAAERAAKQAYMYLDDGAFGRHPMADKTDTPTALEIWQAQMSLWIQQDIATALYRCNEERAAQLRQQGMEDRLWVAYMPVKRLLTVSIDSKLPGGGSNPAKFADSFTGIKNDEKKFVVPIQVQLIVEESAIMNVLGYLSGVGFYTPIAVSYRAVPPDPFLETGFVYGDDPVVLLTVDLEGYYFRVIFEQWIPEKVKQALKTPGAIMTDEGRGGRG